MDLDDKRMHCICFSGHRNAIISYAVQGWLAAEMRTLVKRGNRDFYAGGAMGWDAFCSKEVIALKKKRFKVRLHLILPCCFEEYTQNWTEDEKQELLEILNQADTVEYISEHYTKDCIKKRNQKLVDSAGRLWCFYDKRRKRSGTGQTVRMAEKSGLSIWNYYVKVKSTPQSPNQNHPA